MAEEHAFADKYGFQLAQAINLFYHHHVLAESGPDNKNVLLQLSRLVEVQLVAALDLLAVESPENMYRFAARLESCYDSVVV